MKKSIRIVLILASLLGINDASASAPNSDHPKTFLGPTARVAYTAPLTDVTAFSLAAEAGVKNYRVGGTVGWQFQDFQRVKLTGEFLWQKLTYSFFSGDSEQWVQQGAIGADYQFDFGSAYSPQFDLSVYYSHAFSKDLSFVSGSYTMPAAGATPTLVEYIDLRRIAGSNAGGFSPGLTLQPFAGTAITVAANYDNVSYDTSYIPSQDVKGVGGTLTLNQQLTDSLNVNLTAALRKPFNNYAAAMAWDNLNYYGSWSLGLFANYTIGKNILPDSWDAGVTASYSPECVSMRRVSDYKGNMKGEAGELITAPATTPFLSWVADPAVYMPQVLAVADDQIQNNCNTAAPRLTGTIPGDSFEDDTFSVTPYFSGSNITYSIQSTNAPSGTVYITADGEFSYFDAYDVTYTVVIRATNACGVATSNVFEIGTGPISVAKIHKIVT